VDYLHNTGSGALMGLLPTTSGGTSTPLLVHALAFGQSDQTALTTLTVSANVVYWHPLTIHFDYNIKRFGWANSTNTGNRSINVGIYTTDGTKLYETGTTSFTSPTASVPHYITPAAPVFLPAGTYYIAFRSSAGVQHVAYNYGNAETMNLDAGLLSQNQGGGSTTLPATMASAIRQTVLSSPVVTLHRT
jgi:hypothetical protein